MKRLPASRYQLAERGGPGLACDEEGVALGAVTLVEKRAQGRRAVYRVRPLREIEPALSAAYGSKLVQGDLARRLTCLDAAARALNRGDVARARAAVSMMDLRALSREHRAKRAGDAALAKYSPDQPRVPAGQPGGGQWTRGESDDAPVQVAVNDLGVMTDIGNGILPASASPRPTSATPSMFPEPPGTGNVREYSPAEAAKLPPPPQGSKYVTLNDGSVLWSKYMNHGNGSPMLMPQDASLAENAKRAETLGRMGPDPELFNFRAGSMVSWFLRHYGSMDYQSRNPTVGNYNPDYIDVTNYNYGVVAAAAGYSLDETVRYGGYANLMLDLWDQYVHDEAGKDRLGPSWNKVRNADMMVKGYEDYKAGRIVPKDD